MYQINSETLTLPSFLSPLRSKEIFPEKFQPIDSVIVSDSRYTVRIARTGEEIKEILRLRYQIFKVELAGETADFSGVEEDEFDSTSHHLIAAENSTGEIIGGYRLRNVETNTKDRGFYSAGEFRIGDLPEDILRESVEIGRAVIAANHRSGKVLFLLWRGLAQYLWQTNKRYFFGCCSLFSKDFADGLRAFNRLKREGFMHDKILIKPAKSSLFDAKDFDKKKLDAAIELPRLFQTYLRIGAKVCSPPVLDAEFGTIDFFVLFDSLRINEKYRKMFFV